MGGQLRGTATASYARHRFALVRSWLDAATVAEHAAASLELSFRRVSVGDSRGTWEEHLLGGDSGLRRLLTGAAAWALVGEALTGDTPGRPGPGRARCWLNRYGTGEWIPPHKDAAGTAHLVVCLLAPPPESGGTLRLLAPTGPSNVHLAAGDALLFEATTVEHMTTPLVPTAGTPLPVRTVAVARYFL
ncbi:2OG-Fe(II) oxygenase [Streptomyces sp. NPDC050617]|uniref:2OG-Fe(II) oxygenase n=1 Tax=Streptomyces sp. NPDC050617 TaxID=3154628 RepID=UPI00343F1921